MKRDKIIIEIMIGCKKCDVKSVKLRTLCKSCVGEMSFVGLHSCAQASDGGYHARLLQFCFRRSNLI